MRREPGWLRPVTDYGPLAAFLFAYWRLDLFAATATLMAGSVAAVVLYLVVAGRVPKMPLITAAIALLLGTLTLLLQDESFIKMKPTIVYALFAAVLLGGLALGRPLLRPLMEAAWPMDELGWRRLTLRFGVFFAALAGLNELVWRTQSTDLWVSFKVFGTTALIFAFVLSQLPLLQRHHTGEGS